ncbi:hypothetical protein GQR58_000179 [Nymphon striatum]|nr:hypothetical protein GQR58_000179 [Nymphon striatum]
MTGGASATVLGGIHHNAVQPCGQLGIPAKLRQLGRKGRADILCQVLGLGAGAGQTKGKPEHAVVNPIHKHSKRRTVPARRRHCQVFPDACMRGHFSGASAQTGQFPQADDSNQTGPDWHGLCFPMASIVATDDMDQVFELSTGDVLTIPDTAHIDVIGAVVVPKDSMQYDLSVDVSGSLTSQEGAGLFERHG